MQATRDYYSTNASIADTRGDDMDLGDLGHYSGTESFWKDDDVLLHVGDPPPLSNQEHCGRGGKTTTMSKPTTTCQPKNDTEVMLMHEDMPALVTIATQIRDLHHVIWHASKQQWVSRQVLHDNSLTLEETLETTLIFGDRLHKNPAMRGQVRRGEFPITDSLMSDSYQILCHELHDMRQAYNALVASSKASNASPTPTANTKATNTTSHQVQAAPITNTKPSNNMRQAPVCLLALTPSPMARSSAVRTRLLTPSPLSRDSARMSTTRPTSFASTPTMNNKTKKRLQHTKNAQQEPHFWASAGGQSVPEMLDEMDAAHEGSGSRSNMDSGCYDPYTVSFVGAEQQQQHSSPLLEEFSDIWLAPNSSSVASPQGQKQQQPQQQEQEQPAPKKFRMNKSPGGSLFH